MYVALDMDNAYNSIYRHKVLEKLNADLLYGQRGVNAIYNEKGRSMRRVKSTRGVRQGSVLAALLVSSGNRRHSSEVGRTSLKT